MSRSALDERVRLFGIRHHGPGSARSLVAALDEWRPDIVLIEGPAEAEQLIPHLLHEALKPPVAMLFYEIGGPRNAAYYPLVDFSPEMQAIRWAAFNRCPVRFMDLPASAMLGYAVSGGRRSEAMELAAKAAGFDDVEDWWEHLVEHRRDPGELFQGIEALMTALREENLSIQVEEPEEDPDGRTVILDEDFENVREAHMRRTLREALKGEGKVAVVCGAWHVPALRELGPAKQDDQLLKGLPKVKVGATVVPWTYDRLSFQSGYGAGARSPAFYDLLWQTPAESVPRRWLLEVARLMREEDLDASPASVIDAVRLSETLASLRGHPRPGLRELSEAADATLIRDPAIWSLIGRRLIVGERMGEVPDSVPKIPLQQDLEGLQKRLRMKAENGSRTYELDLRGDTDLERSYLLHRLTLLNVRWGQPIMVTGKLGTFHEHWELRWNPELLIALIEASIYGNTVQAAATARASAIASEAVTLASVAQLLSQVMEANLAGAVEPTIAKLQALSATQADVADLADALPSLAAMLRYGEVRRTDTRQVTPVLDAIFARLCIGLPGACHSLDDEAAHAMSQRLTEVTGVVRLLDDAEKKGMWLETLATIAYLHGCHRLVQGKVERLRFDLGAIDGEWLAQRLRQEASFGATALETAAFIEGLLEGPGAILLHQDALFQAIDDWLVGLNGPTFDEVTPLIRRTFALFAKPERRQIGERVAGRQTRVLRQTEIDEERAQRVLPILRLILGDPQ